MMAKHAPRGFAILYTLVIGTLIASALAHFLLRQTWVSQQNTQASAFLQEAEEALGVCENDLIIEGGITVHSGGAVWQNAMNLAHTVKQESGLESYCLSETLNLTAPATFRAYMVTACAKGGNNTTCIQSQLWLAKNPNSNSIKRRVWRELLIKQ